MRFGLLPLLALTLTALEMHADIDITAMERLPVAWADGLRQQHANPSDRGRAVAADAWSPEEHAQVLLQLMRPGPTVLLKDIRIANRTAGAIKKQWATVLKQIVNAAAAAPSSPLPPPAPTVRFLPTPCEHCGRAVYTRRRDVQLVRGVGGTTGKDVVHSTIFHPITRPSPPSTGTGYTRISQATSEATPPDRSLYSRSRVAGL